MAGRAQSSQVSFLPSTRPTDGRREPRKRRRISKYSSRLDWQHEKVRKFTSSNDRCLAINCTSRLIAVFARPDAIKRSPNAALRVAAAVGVPREHGLDRRVSPSCPVETRSHDAELTIRNAVAAAYFEQNFLQARPPDSLAVSQSHYLFTAGFLLSTPPRVLSQLETGCTAIRSGPRPENLNDF